MNDKISQYKELYDLIEIDLCLDDYTIPDTESHLVFLKEDDVNSAPVAISITGAEWDILYWINRLNEGNGNFYHFVLEFITLRYMEMKKKKNI